MKIIVISEYSLIREGILFVLSKHKDISVEFIGERIKNAMFFIKNNTVDIILLDIHRENVEELGLINDIRRFVAEAKIIILDFYGDNEIFVKALKNGVQGYILGNSSETEMLYVIDQIYKGKKYFDSYFIDNMINKNSNLPNKLELLTAREREILIEVANGELNKKIAEKLLITEHTVKKHINHILSKLNVDNRTEIALYANKYGILNK